MHFINRSEKHRTSDHVRQAPWQQGVLSGVDVAEWMEGVQHVAQEKMQGVEPG